MQWHNGFSIITGETGAGKSILLGALSLILGKRADSSALNDKSKKCSIEGVFQIEKYGLDSFFQQHDLDYDAQTILRREIAANGKSRAFINDTPVTLPVMKELGERLIDIHSQHQTLQLGNQWFQFKVIDTLAQHDTKLKTYKADFNKWTKLKKELATIQEAADKARADLDYFQFQFNQLDEAQLQAEEQEQQETELNTLSHAEEIKSNLSQVSSILYNDNNINTIDMLREAEQLLRKLTSFSNKAEELAQRTESSLIEIQDIAAEAESLAEQTEYNPGRAEEINDRLNLIYSLQQKHRVDTIAELLELKDSFDEKIQSVVSSDDQLIAIKEQIAQLEVKLLKQAEAISSKRRVAAKKVQSKVESVLTEVGMPNANFQVEINTLDTPNINGIDQINFLFSANKNGDLQEVSKVASGGEMSRVMLALKTLLSHSSALPTIIFDEIDTGVSGEIAGKIGNILREMAKGMQVINITHLPQVAGKGDFHYLVYKKDNAQETISHIRRLNREERIAELAKMLSGEQLTEAAINNAKELLLD
jgi:DNA repair protein RecN (Recombination protein N)